MCERTRAIFVNTTIIAFSVILITHEARSGTLSTWGGSNGDWNVAANWSPGSFYPNNGNGAPSYDVLIGSGTVNLNTDVTLSSLTLTGGLLNGSGNLATDALTLNNGTLSTTGTITSSMVALTAGTLART